MNVHIINIKLGEEEDDMVFVRNDRFGTDYEVQAYDAEWTGPSYEGGDD